MRYINVVDRCGPFVRIFYDFQNVLPFFIDFKRMRNAPEIVVY